MFINTAESNNAQVIDAATGKIAATVNLPGRPEQMTPDGNGNIFLNIVDKGEVAEYDATTLAIKHTWPSGPCQHGYGIAIDKAHRRLFVACQPSATSGVFVVMNADTSQVVASMPIGIGSDGAAFDPTLAMPLPLAAIAGDGQNGATYIFHQDSPDRVQHSCRGEDYLRRAGRGARSENASRFHGGHGEKRSGPGHAGESSSPAKSGGQLVHAGGNREIAPTFLIYRKNKNRFQREQSGGVCCCDSAGTKSQ